MPRCPASRGTWPRRSPGPLPSAPEESPGKLDGLAGHGGRLGRDRGGIGVSWLGSVILAPTHARAETARNEFLAARGMDWNTLPDNVRELVNEIQRALVLAPVLLLADEPTGKLDEENGSGVHTLLEEMHEETDLTNVVVTHKSELANRMQRRWFMQDGRLVEVSA